MVSEEAVNAAAEVLFERDTDENDGSRWFYQGAARAALDAAMPHIRQELAAHVQIECDNSKANGMTGYAEGMRDAARIVKGQTNE